MVLRAISVVLLTLEVVHSGVKWDKIDVKLPWLPFENETRCYDDLGCLNITRSWYHLKLRPINLFPLSRNVINTKFILYTRDNPNEGTFLRVEDGSTIEDSHFNPNKSTKFIVHGFIDTPLSIWVREMKNELMEAADINIIVVDWAEGSSPPYTRTTANTRLVGMEIAHLIKFLMKTYETDASDIHIIGHSLGAHIAGYAGQLVPKLGRITGLDPSGPFFQGMPPHVRLDPTDAELVDVIHTDGEENILLGYGMLQSCGHLDFYPNNGKKQPGCDIMRSLLVPGTLIKDGFKEASRILVACSHGRAIKLFIDSINAQCPYIGHQCSSFEQFMSGKCFTCKPGSADCALMGYHADSSPGVKNNEISQRKYYLTTGSKSPYCRRLYRVKVELAKPKMAESWVHGFIKASLYSSAGVIQVDLTPSGETRLEHGTTFTSVVSHKNYLGGNIKKVKLSWEYESNMLEPSTVCILRCNNHLYVESVVVEQMGLPGRGKTGAPFSNKLCPKGNKSYSDIPSRGKGIFLDLC